jgi:hypothetical protein
MSWLSIKPCMDFALHEHFADCLQDLGFQPCGAKLDIQLQANQNFYEYMGVYVDDLAIIAKDLSLLLTTLSITTSLSLTGQVL